MILNLIKKINPDIKTIISDEGQALKSAIKSVFPNAIHKLCAWHISKLISDAEIRNIFWKMVKADHPLLFQFYLIKLREHLNNSLPDLLKTIKWEAFSVFFESVMTNGLNTSSPVESINADIRHMKTLPPMKVFHQLEIIGFQRCKDLLDIKTDMTPYYLKRKEHLIEKAKHLQIVNEESYETYRTIIDNDFPYSQVRWEVDSRSYYCCCGKYNDRSFPCAHMVKALQSMNKNIDLYVHKCYFSNSIQNALKSINLPVPLTMLNYDHSIKPPNAQPRNCKATRHKYGFEKNIH